MKLGLYAFLMFNYALDPFVQGSLGEVPDCPPLRKYNLTSDNPKVIIASEINKTCELRFELDVDEEYVTNLGKGVRLDFETLPDTKFKCPIFFSIIQQDQMISLKLPYNNDVKLSDSIGDVAPMQYWSAARTLCTIAPNERSEDVNIVIVHVNTCSDATRHFNITAKLIDHLLLTVQKRTEKAAQTLDVGPTSPKFYYYEKSENSSHHVEMVIVSSNDTICMTFSIQTLYCPIYIYQHDSDMKYPEHSYQKTMTKSAVMTVLADQEAFKDGFTLVFVVNRDDSYCSSESNSTTRVKRIEVKLVLEDGNWIILLLVPIIIWAIVIVFAGVPYYFHNRYLRIFADYERVTPSDNDPSSDSDVTTVSSQSFPQPEIPNDSNENNDVPSHKFGLDFAPGESLNLSVFDVRELYTSDSGQLDVQIVGIQSVRKRLHPHHFWSMLLLNALFYGLPVIELVVFSVSSTDFDTCFFNELCSHRIGLLFDFNHVISNLLYILLAITFSLLVLWRKWYLKFQRNSTNGIPFLEEVFLAMAIALGMEGMFSGAYHGCPSSFSFQYDTTFMFVIGLLICAYLFLCRHPINYMPSSNLYALHFCFVLLTAISIIFGGSYFVYIYFILQTIAFSCFSIYYVDVGLIRAGKEHCYKPIITPFIVWNRIKSWICRSQMQERFIWSRLTIPMCVLVSSIVVFPVSHVLKEEFVMTVLLTIVLSTGVWFACYVIFKFYYLEYKNWQLALFPLYCLLWSASVGFIAVQYFMQTSYNSNDSPAVSRAKNQNCEMFGYDSHDLWHVLSAVSLFFVYLLLLTLDDGIIKTPRSEIKVF